MEGDGSLRASLSVGLWGRTGLVGRVIYLIALERVMQAVRAQGRDRRAEADQAREASHGGGVGWRVDRSHAQVTPRRAGQLSLAHDVTVRLTAETHYCPVIHHPSDHCRYSFKT